MRIFAIVIFLFATLAVPQARASDACSGLAIETRASVSVSDGTSFETETRFHSAQSAAFTQISDGETTHIAVEGPFGWIEAGDAVELGTEFHKLFALGHQFHALLIHFEAIVANTETSDAVAFLGTDRRAVSGDYPYGGRVHLILGPDEARPVGLKFEFPEIPAISVTFSDWRLQGDTALPYELTIDDGERQFVYAFSRVSVSARSPLWFIDSAGPSPLDEVEVYRLHRRLLAAHCLGDADLMATLSADQIISANRGALSETDRAALKDRFTQLFQAVDYESYTDLQTPRISISAAGDMAWIAVEVRTRGHTVETAEPFDSKWAWIMLAQKHGDRWLHVANASNIAPSAPVP